jgi:hypothetical protein
VTGARARAACRPWCHVERPGAASAEAASAQVLGYVWRAERRGRPRAAPAFDARRPPAGHPGRVPSLSRLAGACASICGHAVCITSSQFDCLVAARALWPACAPQQQRGAALPLQAGARRPRA